MKTTIAFFLAAALLGGCASRPASHVATAPAGSDTSIAPRTAAMSPSTTLDGYKHDLALHISHANSSSVYDGRPQALLRSVIVVHYGIDARGHLTRSRIIRSNHDSVTESTALRSLRASAPFPRPAAYLLRHGEVEISETWLFNNDGRFQLRTIARPQMDE